MIKFIDKFKIPTLLGLSIIFLGIVAGVYLTLREQIFLSQAAPNLTPQNITVTNITDDSVVISWQTNSSAPSFVTFGQSSPGEQTVLEDKDINAPKPHLTHYVTLKNLLPKTSYSFKATSGKVASGVEKFQTAQPLTGQTGFTPVIGSVLDGNAPVNEGIVYLSISGAITQSAEIKTGGNFLIPLSSVRKTDLSDVYQLTDGVIAKLTIYADKGVANALFNLKASSAPLPPIKLGQSIDLTVSDLTQYDLNGDGQVNAADYAILSSCFGKHPTTVLPGGKSCTKADISGDGTIDQKDLDLMSQKLRNQ